MNSSIILHGESDLGLTSPNTHPGGVPLQCCFVALPMYFQGYASDTVTHSKVGLNECVTHVVLSCSFPLPHPFLSVGVRQTQTNLSPISLLRLAPHSLRRSFSLSFPFVSSFQKRVQFRCCCQLVSLTAFTYQRCCAGRKLLIISTAGIICAPTVHF